MSIHTIRSITAITAAAISIVALSGCSTISSLLPGSSASRDAATGEVVEGGQQSAFTMRVGDCWNDISGEEISDVPAVPCSEPHDNEVFGLFELPDGEFPGADTVEQLSVSGCLDLFEDYVGISYDSSSLEVFPLWPTQGSWNEMNDREVVCSLWDPAGLITDSTKGAAR